MVVYKQVTGATHQTRDSDAMKHTPEPCKSNVHDLGTVTPSAYSPLQEPEGIQRQDTARAPVQPLPPSHIVLDA